MSQAVRIVEVSPRDGLQTEPGRLDTATKILLVERLIAAGLKEIEVAGFVRADRVPQLADAEAVCRGLLPRAGARLSALVPNVRGLERARLAGIDAIAFLTAASETFCRRNTGCSICESLDRFRELMVRARTDGILWVRAYVSCAFGCPYEGRVGPQVIADLSGRLAALGCDEIALADTIGVATPAQVREVLQAVSREMPADRLALHLHDTRGQALASVYACLELGIGAVDSSVAGLGGCPFAPGAAGNLATEDLVYMLEGCGIQTGVNLDWLVAVGRFISCALRRQNCSRVGSMTGDPGREHSHSQLA
ncbi:MAG: hydroxymethylglutaryl-CoA lyase [Pseudomonadota bacterium]|nr:hydroxymethylglutaryl-CoA lyase [Pseudomonadota bacterium]